MMVEIIDKDTNQKMMAMILCGISYQNDYYLVYCVRRDKYDANLFASKMIKGSLGYVINNDFSNGEKEVLDNVIKRLLNKDSKELLNNDGFTIMKDIEMDSNLIFNIEKCYVSTVSRNLIKDCLIYYDLVSEKILNQQIVDVVEDKRMFNEGFASSMVLIIFGMVILIFSCIVIYGVLFG